MRALAKAGTLLSVAALLAGCSGDEGAAAACRIDVASADLQDQRVAAGVPDCEPAADANADLPDLALPCLGSETEMALADLEGPAIVNFWSTTCAPCIDEMPALEEFHQQYGDQVTILGVNYQDGYPAAAIDLARRSGTTYPSVADACGALNETDLAVGALPIFLFVAEDGTVTQKAGGIESPADLVVLAEDNGIPLEDSAP